VIINLILKNIILQNESASEVKIIVTASTITCHFIRSFGIKTKVAKQVHIATTISISFNEGINKFSLMRYSNIYYV
jgi:hypothetical protein